ncbi:hypothetical protein RB213_005855 [Colletotrichum asianum]
MPMPLACKLASYITSVFQSPALLGEGIQRSWRPSVTNQLKLVDGFLGGVHGGLGGLVGAIQQCYARHKPAFYAYNYRANIEIEVSKELYDLLRERHCAMDDSEDEEDGEEIGGGWVDDDDNDETLQLEELSVADDGPRRAEVEGVAGAYRCMRSSRGGIDYLENITAVSYALAVCINSNRTTKADRLETCCLLANRNMLMREFASTCDYTFYLNMLSNCPPMFLNLLFAAMKGNMSDQNEGANGYSNIKRSVRHSPHDLLAMKGYATGVLTMLTLDAGAMLVAREKRERLLCIICSPNKLKLFIDVAVEAEEVAFQLEQVMLLDVRRMTSAERTFKTIIRPIF